MNILPLYVHGDTIVHRLGAGTKLLILAVAGTLLFLVDHIAVLAISVLVVAYLFVLAKVRLRAVWHQFSPLLWLLLFVYAGHVIFANWISGLGVVMRLLVLFLLAVLVTLTTPMLAMVDAITQVLAPLRKLGFPVRSISLMLSLTLRYIPLIFMLYGELRQARHARCAPAGTLSLLLPLLIKSFKLADGLAEAIDARGFRVDS